jgi:hypothetical protein
MGGIGKSLSLERHGATPSSAQALFDEIYDAFERNVRRFAQGAAYEQIIAYYLGAAREDCEASDKRITFWFRDAAGLCATSMQACLHWFELIASALPLDEIAARHGYRIATPRRPLAELLESCESSLVELRGNLFSTFADGEEVFLTSDDLGPDTLSIEDLTPSERAEVESVARAKRCVCAVCAALRNSCKVH